MLAGLAKPSSRAAATTLAGLALMALLTVLLVDGSGRSPAGTGSGVAASQARVVAPFTRVDLAGANNVSVRVGGKQSVTVHADDNLLGRVTTRVRSGTLVIDTAPGDLSAKQPMFVDVEMPVVDGLRLDGAGNVSVTGVDSRKLTVALAGAGNIEASGTVATLDVTIGGTGTAALRALVAKDAAATVSGDGTIMVTATRSLIASVSGTGSILYGGSPARVVPRITGSGTITAG
jgi:hypothetical protein